MGTLLAIKPRDKPGAGVLVVVIVLKLPVVLRLFWRLMTRDAARDAPNQRSTISEVRPQPPSHHDLQHVQTINTITMDAVGLAT